MTFRLKTFICDFISGKYKFLLTLVFITLIIRVFTMFPHAVEKLYSRFLFKHISFIINIISSKIKYSLAEIMMLIFFLAVMTICFIAVVKIIKSANKEYTKSLFKKYFYRLVCFLFVLYISFMLLWGLNYFRLPLASYMKKTSMTEDDLKNVSKILIKRCNNLRAKIKTPIKTYSIKSFAESMDGLDRIYERFDFLNMKSYSSPKPIFISSVFLMLNITGIYFPFTAEANVNYMIPAQSIPFISAHELAHQKGIAHEDEANFLAFAENYMHEDAEIAYSVSLEALIYLMLALDKKEYPEISKLIDENVSEDIKKIFLFWEKYNTVLGKVSNAVNDLYLKANSQKDGVKSYNEVVRLIVNFMLEENESV